jgi:hypothetical protein
MNFHDSLKNRAARAVPGNREASLHPDVYFHLNFVPFVNRNASA